MKGKILMARGRINMRHFKNMEISFPFMEQNFNFISRMPRVLENKDGLILPFSSSVWMIVICSLLCLSVMFYMTHSLYTSPDLIYVNLHKSEMSASNFFLFTFGKMTEPDPIPWFSQKWSTGKFLAFVWSLFSLLIVSFYNCNLRAHLSAVDYEKPVESADDVILHRKRPWLIAELAQNQ